MTVGYRVLIADPMSAAGLRPLHDDPRFELVERTRLSGDMLAEAIEGCDAVIVRSSTRITAESLSRADRLRIIGRAGVGVDNIDVAAATARGIAVLNAPAGNTISAAELTLALLLALVRRLPAADRSMKAGEWDRKSFRGTELNGKTLGLVGAGRIGGEVARRARAFGMRVVAYDPFLTEERAQALELERLPLDDVLERADVLSLHVPLTEATANLIGAAQLARMKPGAYLVNAARGGVVDEAALYRALVDGHLAGAALDVFAEEPLPADHPLRSLSNVVLTPHLGAQTAEAQELVAIEIAEAVRDALLENDLSRAVNAPAVGGEEMRRLRPLLELAQRLGRLAAALAVGPPSRATIVHAGTSAAALHPIAASAMVGVLEEAVGRGGVNFVNSLHLAASRHMSVSQVHAGPHRDYAEYIEVRLGWDGAEARASGALLGGSYPRVVRILDYHVDVPPRGTLVVLRNRDVPGVIGRVGTLLGGAGVNIAEYHQARREAGGEALAAISVDGKLTPELLERLRGEAEVVSVRPVELDKTAGPGPGSRRPVPVARFRRPPGTIGAAGVIVSAPRVVAGAELPGETPRDAARHAAEGERDARARRVEDHAAADQARLLDRDEGLRVPAVDLVEHLGDVPAAEHGVDHLDVALATLRAELGHAEAQGAQRFRQLDTRVLRDDAHARQPERELLLHPQPDEVATREPAGVRQDVPAALQVPDRAPRREDPDQHLEEADQRHEHARVAHREQRAHHGERNVADPECEDQDRSPGTGKKGVQPDHASYRRSTSTVSFTEERIR